MCVYFFFFWWGGGGGGSGYDLEQYVHDLPSDVKPAPSVALFKHGIKRNIKEPSKYYNDGTRKGQVLHARLRLECSFLDADLYRKQSLMSMWTF